MRFWHAAGIRPVSAQQPWRLHLSRRQWLLKPTCSPPLQFLTAPSLRCKSITTKHQHTHDPPSAQHDHLASFMHKPHHDKDTPQSPTSPSSSTSTPSESLSGMTLSQFFRQYASTPETTPLVNENNEERYKTPTDGASALSTPLPSTETSHAPTKNKANATRKGKGKAKPSAPSPPTKAPSSPSEAPSSPSEAPSSPSKAPPKATKGPKRIIRKVHSSPPTAPPQKPKRPIKIFRKVLSSPPLPALTPEYIHKLQARLAALESHPGAKNRRLRKSLRQLLQRANATLGPLSLVPPKRVDQSPDNLTLYNPSDFVQEPVRGEEPVKEVFLKHDTTNAIHMYASDLALTPLPVEQPPVPRLSHGLDRVIFNKGVYQLQDPHSRVYNFDPYLQQIMPVAQFDYTALADYKTSSQDPLLSRLAEENNLRYVGSTSSMTSTLTHFHFLLSNWRPLNVDMLSRSFNQKPATTFTGINQAPNAIFLRYKNGTYAIDADKEYDSANVLMLLGKSLEKLLTMSPDQFERYRKSDPREISESERNTPDSFHFSSQGGFLMRSQLDAHDPRLPGTGMFDLKTRAVLPVRMQSNDYEEMSGYELFDHQGEFESYEREFHDMLRSTMLKYSLQVRMGRMDGIYVAYHNVKRIFGFQYLTLGEMDRGLHGQSETCLGDQEFLLSIGLLNKILDKATERYPGQSLRLHFETRPSKSLPFMYIFAEPMSDNDIDTIQNSQKAKIREFERSVMGLEREEKQEGDAAEPQDSSAAMDGRDTVHQEDKVVNSQNETIDMVETEALPTAVTSQDETVDLNEIRSGTIKMTDGQQSNLVEDVGTPTSTTPASEPTSMSSTTESVVASGSTASFEEDITSWTEKKSDSTELDSILLETVDLPDTSPDPTPKPKASDRPLLAMTLTVRSMVDGRYVDRPEKLGPGNDWSIEYSLNEIPAKRAWTMYEATKTRRRNALSKGATSKENGERTAKDRAWNMYLNSLRRLAAKGRQKRAEIDRLDVDRKKVVFGEPYGKIDEDDADMVKKSDDAEIVDDRGLSGGQGKSAKSDDVVNDGKVEIQGVDDYMQWLFREQGKR